MIFLVKRLTFLIALFLLFFTIISTAYASRGVIAFYNNSTFKMIIATNRGFTVGNVLSVPSLSVGRGNVVGGNLENFASQEVYDLTADEGFTLWIEQYWPTASQAIDWLEQEY